VIERREEIAQSIREIIEETAASWGVQVESMLIKDIVFSQELQDSLSMAAQSKRTGEAKVIAARAEVESAKLMRQAADILASPAAMQIRYLEAMQAMARTSGSKVIFLPGSQGQMVQSMGALAGAAANAGIEPGAMDFGSQQGDYVTGLSQAAMARNIENL
jgi:erythrocyte band 7 integral membrane protein